MAKEDKKEDENQNKDREIEEKKTGLPAAGEQKVIGTENDSEVEQEEQLEQVQEEAAEEVEEPIEEAQEEDVGGLVIAQVSNYVNVRGSASEEGEVVGKLYNHSAGELVKKEGDWYQITSGDVTGYVKAEFVVTGEAAVELAKEVGNRIAVVNTTTLKVRQSPDTEASVLGLVPEGDVLTVSEEQEGYCKICILRRISNGGCNAGHGDSADQNVRGIRCQHGADRCRASSSRHYGAGYLDVDH